MGPRKTNPPVVPAEGIEAHLKVDPEVSPILERACRNCHSHQTRWPWYSNVAPVSWFVIDNVNFGRRKMNLSNWDQYDQEETVREAREMQESLRRYVPGAVAEQLSSIWSTVLEFGQKTAISLESPR